MSLRLARSQVHPVEIARKWCQYSFFAGTSRCQTDTPSVTTKALQLRTLAFLNASAFFIVLIVFQSTFALMFGAFAATVCLALVMVTVLIGAGFAVINMQLMALAIAASMVCLLIFQVMMFSHNSGYPINWNALFSWVPMFAFIIFVNPKLDYAKVFKVLFWASIAYSVLYIGLYDQIANAEVIDPDEPAVRVLASDGTRDVRVFLAAAFPTFALFYCVSHMHRRWYMYLGLALLPAGAMILAQSRFHFVLLVLSLLAYAVGRKGVDVGRYLQFAFYLFAVTVFVSVTFDWNPFIVVASDVSGSARTRAFEVLTSVVSDHFLFGAGLSTNRLDEVFFLRDVAVFWDDVGLIGIWYVFGLGGMIFFTFQSGLCIRGLLPSGLLQKDDRLALNSTALVHGLASVISPAIWLGSGTAILAVLFAIWLRQRGEPTRRKISPPWRRPRTWRDAVLERAASAPSARSKLRNSFAGPASDDAAHS